MGLFEKKPNTARTTRLAFNRAEAAKILGISQPTLDRLVRRGLIAPSRATRRPLFAKTELERFLQDTTTKI
jgi:excisionase family DNA binding protein|tara:strand:+ start:757 stop:969 length:213 start_codon:yes stop_codon:yes gene_type:complete